MPSYRNLNAEKNALAKMNANSFAMATEKENNGIVSDTKFAHPWSKLQMGMTRASTLAMRNQVKKIFLSMRYDECYNKF